MSTARDSEGLVSGWGLRVRDYRLIVVRPDGSRVVLTPDGRTIGKVLGRKPSPYQEARPILLRVRSFYRGPGVYKVRAAISVERGGDIRDEVIESPVCELEVPPPEAPRAGNDSRKKAPDYRVPTYVVWLMDERAWTRCNGIEKLGKAGRSATAAIPDLIAALKDRNFNVRVMAVWALGRIGPGRAKVVAALHGALSDVEWRVRRRAALALRETGARDRASVLALAKCLDDEDYQVCLAAAQTLLRLGSGARDAAPALAAALRDRGAAMRWHAATTLGRIGPPAKASVPSLTTTLKDPIENVRQAAAEALKKIRSKEQK